MSGGPVVVDLRGFQTASAGDVAAGLLREARAGIGGAALLGLVDPSLPAAEAAAESCDGVCGTAYAAAAAGPRCFVALAPAGDPLFAARLLGDEALPCFGLARAPGAGLDAAVWRYWMARVVAVPPERLWAEAAAARRDEGLAGPLTVLSATPDGVLEAGFAAAGATVRTPSELPLLRTGRVAVVVRDARSLGLLRRYGGEAVLAEASLIGALDDETGPGLAAAALGRPVPAREWRQWREGIAPAPPLFGAAVAAASRVFVTSGALEAAVRAEDGGKQVTVLPPVAALRVRAAAAGLQAEACVWALEWLGFRGVEARLELVLPRGEKVAELTALAERLGVGGRVRFGGGGIATLFLFLGMPGAPGVAPGLAGELAAASGAGLACVASESVARAAGVAVPTVPDAPSPVLLAEAMARAAPDPGAWRAAVG